MLAFTRGSALVAATVATTTTLLLTLQTPQLALAAPAPVAGTDLFHSLYPRSSSSSSSSSQHHSQHNDEEENDDNDDEEEEDEDDEYTKPTSTPHHKYSHKIKLSKYDARWRHSHKITPDALEAWALNERKRILHRHHRHVRTSHKAKAKSTRPNQDEDDEEEEEEDDDDDDDENEVEHQKRSIEEAIEARATGSLGSQGLDQFYFAQVNIGTPAQPMNLYLDTGSADLWIIGKNCHGTYSDYCTQVPLLDSSQSTTYKSDRRNQSNYQTVSYVDGSGFSGWLGSDTVNFAGYTLPDVKFITVDDLESDPNQQPTSGLMGLSYQAESVSGSKPFLQTLADTKQFNISANGFGLALTRQPRNKTTTENGYDGTAAGGIIDIGEIDPTSYSGELRFIDIPQAVQKDGSWAIPIDDVTVAGKSIAPGLRSSDKNTAYIDSGTSLFYQPRSINRAFFDTVDGAEALTGDMKGYYSMPCNAKTQLALTFGGVSYAFNDQDLIAGALDDNGETCLAAVSDSDGSGVDFLVGATFHKNYYIFYSFGIDGRGPQIGFANLPATGAPASATGTGAYSATSIASPTSTGKKSSSHPQNSFATPAVTGYAGYQDGSDYSNSASSTSLRKGIFVTMAVFVASGVMILL